MYMHHVIIRQKEALQPTRKRKLLFLAGFGSSGASYFELYGELHKHFEVHIPDLLGFGSSGRPDFLCKTAEDTAAYFITCLRKWMDTTGFDKDGSYSIMAHSLGCWIASLFAVQYPDKIDQLMFLSPACMARSPPDFCPHAFIRRYSKWG